MKPRFRRHELTQIQAVCQSLKIRPKITFIVVVKRHHMRFFQGQKEQERNCVAGTIIDQDVVLPTEFNFFLQSHSHGGKYGTSRPAHYSVLHDENRLSPDTIQALTFALCHVYTRFTRAVSIPAPVYYADRVCARGAVHFGPKTPGGQVEGTSVATPAPAHNIERQQEALQILHPAQQDAMFFA
ncbi:Piwi domain-containing protein [Mycena latifolia]|nr:Piwi domain-containing protein [Mycena latifolia]